MQKKVSQNNNQRRSLAVISIVIFGGLILVSIVWSLYVQNRLGFSGKTLWDWLDLLLVPILLILVLPAASWVIRKAQERYALIEREIAQENHREKALQSYMEVMTDLILEKGLGTSEDQDG